MSTAAAGWADRVIPARRSLAYLSVALLVVVLSQLTAFPVIIREVLTTSVGLSVVAVIAVAAPRNRRRTRAAWTLIGASQLFWAVAALRPTPGNAFHLIGCLVLASGLVILGSGRFHGTRDLGPLVDSATSAAALCLVAAAALTGPATTALHRDTGRALQILAGPALDIVLIAALMLQVGSPGGRSVAFRYLGLALGLLLYADTLAAVLELVTPGSAGALGYFWLVSAGLIGTAVAHPSVSKLSVPSVDPEIRFRGLRLLALVGAITVGPAVLALHRAGLGGVDEATWLIVLASMAIALLVVIRMDLTLEQMGTAHRSLEVLQDELAVQAAQDPLTGLSNRTQSMRQIAGALGRSRRRGSTVGALFVDLDGFKLVNDEHGHRTGDEVLREVARRMAAEIRDGDTMGRLGGDEFLVVIEDVPDERAAVTFANRLIARISEPIGLASGASVQVGASVGIALGRGGEADVEGLVHEADLAVYQAKAEGRGCVELFSGKAREALRRRNDIERAMAGAIAHDELVLHYQPIVDLRTGAVACYEALVRWDRPGVGLLPPDEFLPVAETSDLICHLDVWVLHAVVAQLAVWNVERGDRDLQVAVNVSGRHISQTRIQSDVAGALLGGDVDPRQLVIEVTETALMDGSVAAMNMQVLRNAGVEVSLDDYGTGYQSPTQLSRLPIDVLKIDGQYVDVSPGSASARSLLELMVTAGHAFGLRVVAEGIERADQLELARELGCEYVQGYYVGVPLRAADVDPAPSRERLDRPRAGA